MTEIDDETNYVNHKDLEKAYRMEPELPFPYKAYHEICALDERIPQRDGDDIRCKSSSLSVRFLSV